MLTLILLGATLALVGGLIAKFGSDFVGSDYRVTWFEFTIGALVCTLLVIPAVTVVGVKQARASTMSYNEYWNGWEKTADVATTNCTRDGSCRHTYECDPYLAQEQYTVQVPYSATESYSVSDGKGGTSYRTRTVTKYRTEYRTRTVTRYHQCPYSKVEHTYTVSTTLGDTYTLGDHWMPANPQEFRYRAFTAVPSRYPSGVPALWQAAKNRLDAGRAGGVTKVMTYPNYLLASQSTLLHAYSGSIADYQREGLMPNPSKGIIEPYLANKVYFVGKTPGSAPEWQEALMRANAKIGTERRGDLHLVLVTDPRITNPDEYALAVQAHWQDPSLGKNALSKNGLVYIVGSTDGGKSVSWVRVFTGMPEGNEGLIASALGDSFKGTPVTPQALLALPDRNAPAASASASVTATVTATATARPDALAQVTAAAKTAARTEAKATGKTAVAGAPSPAIPLPTGTPAAKPTAPAIPVLDPTKGGAIIASVFGPDGFKRACMKGCGDGDVGYAYLIDQIQPTGGQKAGIVAIGFGFALAIWAALLALGITSPVQFRNGKFALVSVPARSTNPRRGTSKGARYANSPAFERLMDPRRARGRRNDPFDRYRKGSRNG